MIRASNSLQQFIRIKCIDFRPSGGGSTMVENSTHQPKVEGSNPFFAATRGEK